MQRVREFVDENAEVFFIDGIDLFPVDDHTRRPGVSQHREHAANKTILSILRTVREIFDCFRLPAVANQIGQQRHQRNATARREFRQSRVRVDL